MQLLSLPKARGFEIHSLSDGFRNAACSAVRWNHGARWEQPFEDGRLRG